MDVVRLLSRRLFLLFLSSIFLLSCETKKGLQEEYIEIAQATSRLSHGRLYVIDVDSSRLDWEVFNQNGKKISGRLGFEKGSLILEKERLVAGFVEGSLLSNKLISNELNLNLNVEKRKLLDSNLVLKTESGNVVRFDIEQSGHQYFKSGFKENVNANTDTSVTHLLQVEFTFADSTRSISIPSKLKKLGSNQILSANLNINFPDFGVKFNRFSNDPNLAWNTSVAVKLRLVFKQYVEVIKN